MNATHFASLAEQVRRLPAEGAGRSRSLFRLTDEYASSEAAAALQTAAARAGKDTGVLANALDLARVIWPERPEAQAAAAEDAAARDRARDAFASPAFLSLATGWVRELREVASSRPGTGACTIASALQLWLWTMNHFRSEEGARGEAALRAVDDLAEALCPLLAARCLALEIAATGTAPAGTAADLRTDLCHVHAAHASSRVGATCAELVFGYRRHLRWDAEGCAACYGADELDELEAWMPGIASGARAHGDVVEADGSHPAKAGPCARFDGVDTFTRLRTRLDGCLTGARLARDRAAAEIERSIGQATTPSRASEGTV